MKISREKYLELELANCPFCANEASMVGANNGGFQIKCTNEDCGCSLPAWLSFDDGCDVAEKITLAAKYWNERKNDAPKMEGIKMSPMTEDEFWEFIKKYFSGIEGLCQSPEGWQILRDRGLVR